MQIFFSLLASVALTSASEQNAGSNMDILLVVLYCLPDHSMFTFTFHAALALCRAAACRLGRRAVAFAADSDPHVTSFLYIGYSYTCGACFKCVLAKLLENILGHAHPCPPPLHRCVAVYITAVPF